ncbi:MAG: hypothetical protein ACRDZ8_15325 [Acidimicrobiales bacterium]
MVETSIDTAVECWIAELSEGQSVAASSVQDRLFDLWGLLDEGDTRREVERWLTETLDRHLYPSDEVVTRLRRLGGLASIDH